MLAVLALLLVIVTGLEGWWLVQQLPSILQIFTQTREERWRAVVQKAVDQHFGCHRSDLAKRVRIVSRKQKNKYEELIGVNVKEELILSTPEALMQIYFKIPDFLGKYHLVENYALHISNNEMLDVYSFHEVDFSRPSQGLVVSIGIDSKNRIRFLGIKKVGSREGIAGNVVVEMMFTRFDNYEGCLVPTAGSFEVLLPVSNTESRSIYVELLEFEYSAGKQTPTREAIPYRNGSSLSSNSSSQSMSWIKGGGGRSSTGATVRTGGRCGTSRSKRANTCPAGGRSTSTRLSASTTT